MRGLRRSLLLGWAAGLGWAVLLLLVVAACGSAGSTADTLLTPASGTPAAATASPDSYEAALARSIEAGSHRFFAELTLVNQSQPLQVTMDGWVDGADRELVVGSGDQQLRTVVIGGVATVDGPGGGRPVPLAEAAAAPSLELLGSLRDLDVATAGRATGVLPAAALPAGVGGQDLSGDARVTVSYVPGGTITGYAMSDVRGRWEMTVVLWDVGASISS